VTKKCCCEILGDDPRLSKATLLSVRTSSDVCVCVCVSSRHTKPPPSLEIFPLSEAVDPGRRTSYEESHRPRTALRC
jgi:hypothetical protein